MAVVVNPGLDRSDGGASKEVTGYSGGGVLIKCEYDAEYTENIKYFCKGSWPDCSYKIKTEAKNKWENSGNFAMFDDTRSEEFWVMIRELTVQDSGTYQCGVDLPSVMDIYTPVELNVEKDFVSSRDVTAYVGTRSNIKCRYEGKYKQEKKAFLKIKPDQEMKSLHQIKTLPDSEWSHDGRFSIHDNRSAGFFSVFIRELITEDTGTYACVVVLSDETEVYTVVRLNVTEDPSFEKSIGKTVTVGEDLTVSCKYPEFLAHAPKFLCKRPKLAACLYKTTVSESKRYVKDGKVTLYDDRERQIFTVSFRNVIEQDSEEYWCGAEVNWKANHGYKVYFTRIDLEVTGFPVSIVITVCLVLLVLLIGILFLVVILRKRCCAEQLADVFTDIFNISLSTTVVPTCFKTTFIVPMPRKSMVSCLNDYRPIAFTPIAMKWLERLVMGHIKSQLPPSLDPIQFAYPPNRSTEDAITTTLHLALTHLDNKNTYLQMSLMGLNTSLCNWILDFLTGRPQSVRIGNSISSTTTLSTRAPQAASVSYGKCTILNRKTLHRIVWTAEKIIGVSIPSITYIYTTRCIRKTNSIVDDPTPLTHTLHPPAIWKE
ncbi:hypothetical protein QTP70_028491, partial [Hemibagrus guttatus]